MDTELGSSALWRESLIVGVVVSLVAAICGGLQFMAFDNYSFLADAFLHGRLWVDGAPSYISFVQFEGHDYVIEPPFPAFLMLPLALFFHEQANQTIVAVLMLGIGSAACWMMLRSVPLVIRDALLLLAVMLFATSYFFGGMRGDVWQLSNVTAVSFTFLLVNEVRGRNRPLLVAFLALAAGLSRYTLLPLIFVYGIAGANRFGWKYARSYAFVAFAGLSVYGLYNFGRWHSFLDRGYDLYRIKSHYTPPMFELNNVGRQLWQMFCAPPLFQASFPWVVPDLYGTGMFFTSLVLFTALLAPRVRSVNAGRKLTRLMSESPV